MRAVDEDNRAYTPWMPFSTPAFIALLAEALAEADVTPRTRRDLVFLDIGCGPGPKMLVARDLFGLDAHGFDRREEYVKAACSLGLDAKTADAETFEHYGAADVLWANRVARDGQIQARIEQKMLRDMKPGATVIMANYEVVPPGWYPILEDAETRRGIWQKPSEAPAKLPGSTATAVAASAGHGRTGRWFPSTAQEPFPADGVRSCPAGRRGPRRASEPGR